MAWQRLDAASIEPRRCKERLADWQARDRIIGKANDGRGHEVIREIPEQSFPADVEDGAAEP